MYVLLSIPVPLLPNAFLYEVAFASILAVVLALVAINSSFRKRQFTILLIPIGIIELSIVAYYSSNSYYIPHKFFIICFGTVTSGIIIPIFYAARRLLSKTVVRLLLSFQVGLNWLSD